MISSLWAATSPVAITWFMAGQSVCITCTVRWWLSLYSPLLYFVEFVGNLFPSNGELFTGFPRTAYIINDDAVTIPFDGYIHKFHAQIKVAGQEVRFQIWRVDSATRNSILVGEESFTTTTEHTETSETEVSCLLWHARTLRPNINLKLIALASITRHGKQRNWKWTIINYHSV